MTHYRIYQLDQSDHITAGYSVAWRRARSAISRRSAAVSVRGGAGSLPRGITYLYRAASAG
jgi:hypothetical protein